MENEINKTVLCLLCHNQSSNRLYLEYYNYEQCFVKEIAELEELSNQKNISIKTIINYINKNPQLKNLEGNHNYCISLTSKYQGFKVNIKERVNSLIEKEDLFQKKHSDALSIKKLTDYIQNLKADILNDFKLWTTSFSLSQAYKDCQKLDNIFVFSHRKIGWSMPEFSLSPNFYCQLMTNFGYGNSSYFYLQIRYKNIIIIPLSEWISYKNAHFSSLMRYSKSFTTRIYRTTRNGEEYYESIIQDENWKRAFEYTIEACNCSIENESLFIQKYVVDECRVMVQGLTNIFNNSSFKFEGETGKYYDIDINGHQLIEFRGEKISGALDFIEKIMEYKEIILIEDYLNQIEKLNTELKPILKKEISYIKSNIVPLKENLSQIKEQLSILKEEKELYKEKKNQVREELINKHGILFIQKNIDLVSDEFLSQYPCYDTFIVELKKVKEKHSQLRQKIVLLETIKDKINSHYSKINDYFEK